MSGRLIERKGENKKQKKSKDEGKELKVKRKKKENLRKKKRRKNSKKQKNNSHLRNVHRQISIQKSRKFTNNNNNKIFNAPSKIEEK